MTGACRGIVVVPARDEEARIGACLEALAGQTIGRDSFAVVVVLDACRDATAEVAETAGRTLGLELTAVPGPGAGVGWARRVGMDLACARLLAAGPETGLIASTDADSRPAPDWLERQLAHVDRGALAIAGLIELDVAEAAQLSRAVRGHRRHDAAARLARVRALDPTAGHHHFGGASFGVTAGAYRRVGGLEPVADLEDATFERRLRAHGVPVLRAADVRVHTSARRAGRAGRGLAVDLAVADWRDRGRHRAADFPVERLRRHAPRVTVTVIVPGGPGTDALLGGTVAPLAAAGLLDEVVVLGGVAPVIEDAALRACTRTLPADGPAPRLGRPRGRGDALWRTLAVTRGELVCVLDPAVPDPGPERLAGLLGPLLDDPAVAFVKAAYDRPPGEASPVAELMARPLLARHVPRLAAIADPLAREFAARRELLESIPFAAGEGVEVGVLVDAVQSCGLDALAECRLGPPATPERDGDAGELACAVLAAVEHRISGRPDGIDEPDGRLMSPGDPAAVISVVTEERPALRASPPPPPVAGAAASDQSRRRARSSSPSSTRWPSPH
jgi:glucosyl-3-phosphoglycerate synthase